jgi:predicted dehydrogenase
MIRHEADAVWARSGGPARMPVHDGGSLAGKLSVDVSWTSSDGSSRAAGPWPCTRGTSGAPLSLSFLPVIISSTAAKPDRIHAPIVKDRSALVIDAGERGEMSTRDTPNVLRVGLIGYGLAGASFHAPLIATTAELRLVIIVTSNPERQRDAARAHPDARIVDSAARLWENARDLDLIVVASPNRTHAPLTLEALAHDLHVVVDKPFATTVKEARLLVAEASRRGLVLTVFQNRRWDGDFLTLQKLLARDALGNVLRFESRFDRWRPVPRDNWRERGSPEEAGGLLFDLGSHLIDQALLLFGPARSVYAELDRRRDGVQVDDDSFVALTHAGGVRSHLFMTAMAAQPGPRFRVLGTRAAYMKWGMDPQEAKLRDGQRPDRPGFGDEPAAHGGKLGAGEDIERVPTEPGAYRRFYEAVVAAVRGTAPPPVDPRDAIAGLAVIEAAREAAAEQRVVTIATVASTT